MPETLRVLSLPRGFQQAGLLHSHAGDSRAETHPPSEWQERGKSDQAKMSHRGVKAPEQGCPGRLLTHLTPAAATTASEKDCITAGKAALDVAVKTCGSLGESFRACCPVILLQKAGSSVVSLEWMGTESFIRSTQ